MSERVLHRKWFGHSHIKYSSSQMFAVQYLNQRSLVDCRTA